MSPRDILLFWFGTNYEWIDHRFRKQHFVDPVARQVFVPEPPRMSASLMEPGLDRYAIATVTYDTVAGRYLSLEGYGIRIDLSQYDRI